MSKREVVRKLMDKFAASRERHRTRHRASGYGFVFADRLAYLDAARWDAITAGASVFMRRPYLMAVETCGPANITPRYAIIFRDEVPAAALVLQVVELSGSSVTCRNGKARSAVGKSNLSARAGAAVKGASKQLRTSALSRINSKFLVCGNLMSWGLHGVAIAEGEDGAAMWPAIAEAIYRVRRAEKLSSNVSFVMVKDFSQADAGRSKTLETFSYESMPTDPDMVLDFKPEWTSHEDYLAAMSSKYRKGIVKLLRDVKDAGWTVDPLANPAESAERLHALYLQVHDKAAVRLFTLRPEFIPTLAGLLGADFRCTVVRKEGDIAGFVTTLKDGDTAVGYYLGYDKATNETVPVYFRLLHAVIADSIAMGCKRLSLGRTALEPKARLGARPVPLNVWIRHRHPMMNQMLRPFVGLVPHGEAPERSPFKEA